MAKLPDGPAKGKIAKLAAGGPPEPPYGPPIHQAIARGDLTEMKALLKNAETYLSRAGDVATAVTKLKAEISKLEKR